MVEHSPPLAREIVVKTLVIHTVTYFVVGVAAFVVFDYRTLIEDTALGLSMRPLNDPILGAGPLMQPIRGVLFGFVFYVLREPFFGRRQGWLTMWMVLVSVGILGTFGAPPGSLEGVIYTVVPLSIHLRLLPEVVLQSLLLSWLVFHWVNRPSRKWLNWTMGVAVVMVLLISALGFLVLLRR